MQTWARRGVRAALVTGGVLAVGTGVASAEDNSDQPTLGDGQLTWDDVRKAGGVFTEPHPSSAVTRISGTIDSERDLLPAVENELTQEIPVLTAWHDSRAEHRHARHRQPQHQLRQHSGPGHGQSQLEQGQHNQPPQSQPRPDEFQPRPGQHREPQHANPRHQHNALAKPVELAGWVADAGQSGEGSLPSPVRVGTPAEGFHRSLSWDGPIGGVVRGSAETTAEIPITPGSDRTERAQPERTQAERTEITERPVHADRPGTPGQPLAPGQLLTPGEDLVYVDGFDQPDTVSRWEQAARSQAIGQHSASPQERTDRFEVPRQTTERSASTGADGPLIGLLNPAVADLTSADLSRASMLYSVPRAVLNTALAATWPTPPMPSSYLGESFTVPGEYQDRAEEVPGTRGLDQLPSVSPTFAGKTAFTGDLERTMPAMRPIEAALRGFEQGSSGPAERVRFSPSPLRTEVAVTMVDVLTAAIPERQWAARNPFPTNPTPVLPSLGGMVLPTLAEEPAPAELGPALVAPGPGVRV